MGQPTSEIRVDVSPDGTVRVVVQFTNGLGKGWEQPFPLAAARRFLDRLTAAVAHAEAGLPRTEVLDRYRATSEERPKIADKLLRQTLLPTVLAASLKYVDAGEMSAADFVNVARELLA